MIEIAPTRETILSDRPISNHRSKSIFSP